ncbi:MAG: ABC transporter ATP-binding protein [Bacteroidota bacterium]|nr:ABC transporter ATP-binding protein [Bacteroidota bacterium]
MSDTIIKVENLSKSYTIKHENPERYTALRDVIANGFKRFSHIIKPKNIIYNSKEEFFALKDLNFEINKGDRIGIIGRNGAGKSTLLKILSRITEPTAGRIHIKGRVASLLEVGTGFHPELTGRENIYLNGGILGMKRSEIKKKFDEIVDFAEVEKFLDTPVKRYSSGMYVRLAFAVAAHLDPEILVIDEVLAVGDTQFQKKCLGKMEDVSKQDGRTILFVSHDISAVNRLCNKGILLNKGKVQIKGYINDVIDVYINNPDLRKEVSFSNKMITHASVWQEDDKIYIECDYNCDRVFKIPCLGFVINDHMNRPIFGLNPLQLPPDTPLQPSQSGKILITVEYPKLLNGIYSLSLWFGDGMADYFIAPSILYFEVIDMIKYEREVYSNVAGPVSPIVKWKQYDYTRELV